ncbi:putative Holliday junction resolvase [Sulfurifustis variabilis]|uniref:Putative pre-16S rRNA nuclease n=1 Tax=Sulfurifustis variabilis TaxID=1675686 RepID=A0A1B4VGQ8_9GAMM|nr:Holliday junction resolvase RuvX [Sulfurifustis variabilis]BAU50037.1 putative Holliday junction resolvase [Sulfurifustis variabilis]
MTAGVYLGFDFGKKDTGVAVGSRHTRLAEPLAVLRSQGAEPDWAALDRVVREWRPEGLVVGLPLNMDGSESPMTRATRAFGTRLAARYNLPVHWVDERLSSRVATDTLLEAGVPLKRHKKRIDKIAAQTILQAFLNETRQP